MASNTHVLPGLEAGIGLHVEDPKGEQSHPGQHQWAEVADFHCCWAETAWMLAMNIAPVALPLLVNSGHCNHYPRHACARGHCTECHRHTEACYMTFRSVASSANTRTVNRTTVMLQNLDCHYICACKASCILA